jgi:DNA polymerase-3 subunit alpha
LDFLQLADWQGAYVLNIDTETTGLPKRWDAPITDTDNWPRCIQIAWQLHDDMGKLIEHQDYLVKPDGFNIPYDAERIHGISTELAAEKESLGGRFEIQ